MSSALLTLGWEGPIGTPSVAAGASGVTIPFEVRDDDGLQSGVDVSSASVIRVSVDGGVTWTNRVGSAPTEGEDGIYRYTADATEVAAANTTGYLLVKFKKTNYHTVTERADVNDSQLAAALITITNAITSETSSVLGEVASVETDLTTLLGRLTAVRSGYLDNLSAGPVATAAALSTTQSSIGDVQTDIDTLQTSLSADTSSILLSVSGVQSDVDDIQSRIPTALTAGGKIKSSTDEWLASAVVTPTTPGVPRVDVKATETGVITADSFATDAIDANAIAASAVSKIQTGIPSTVALTTPLSQKTQFVSTENLKIAFSPFIDRSTGDQYLGTDIVTLTIKRPTGTLLPGPPVPVFDSDIKLWTTTVPFASFIEGVWLIKAVSDGANSQPQNLVLTWGDYVDDIQETRQAALGRWRIDGTAKKLFLYEDDGITVFKTFDLKDSTGTPSVVQIFERDPV